MAPVNQFDTAFRVFTSYYGNKPYSRIEKGMLSTFDLESLQRQVDEAQNSGVKTPTLTLVSYNSIIVLSSEPYLYD